MREIPYYDEWLNQTTDELLLLLARTLRELSLIEGEISLAESEKMKRRVRAYQESASNSVGGRTQEAEIATITFAATLVELHADKATLLEEKFFILRLLDSRKGADS